MKWFMTRQRWLGGAAAVLVWLAGAATAHASATCFGSFPNPVTDICWSCVMPLSIGGATVLTDGQEDIENPSDPVCYCNTPAPRVGIPVGFWEPARIVEVTRTPYCMPTLAGMDLDVGVAAPPGVQETRATQGRMRGSFYQVHFYNNPVLSWMEVLMDYACLEAGGFDVAYMTELDPAWNDDDLTAILNPEALLFANPIAQAACAADCVAASVGFGIESMIWCAGCNGSVYPLNGHVQAHAGGIQASALLAQRMLAKLHRQGMAWQWHGRAALCNPVPAPLIDKRAYKLQLLYPVPNTSKEDGRCCQPLGRTSVIWGMGKEYPIQGEDFAYMVFRKRNCCAL